MSTLTFRPGVMFFPVTAFARDDTIDTSITAAHIRQGVENGAAAVFAACGTGEFHALSAEEYATVITTAVKAVRGAVPVIGGVGGPLGHAVAVAKSARNARVDALLILPPYLVSGTQAGLIAYVERIIAAAGIPVILYHRGAAQFTVESVRHLLANPLVIGIKDGVGDMALMQQFVMAAAAAGRDDLLFFNGLLTAEASQAAYRSIGVTRYSSAAFAMAPQIANAFYRAHEAGDPGEQNRLLTEFYQPLVELRDTTPGYAVSLIKAGLRLAGTPVGSVRPPLVNPSAQHLETLAKLLATPVGGAAPASR